MNILYALGRAQVALPFLFGMVFAPRGRGTSRIELIHIYRAENAFLFIQIVAFVSRFSVYFLILAILEEM